MIVKIEDKEYIIKWEHREPMFANPGPFINHGRTRCRIFKGIREMAHGVAICSKRDQYCKNTGRKISLERALKNTEVNKWERTIVWKSYAKMRKGNFGDRKKQNENKTRV